MSKPLSNTSTIQSLLDAKTHLPPHTPPNFGTKIQYTKEPYTTELLNEKGKIFIQSLSGTLLYLAHAVYITLLTPLGAIT